MLLLQLEFKRVHLTVEHRRCLTPHASSYSSCSLCSQSPWVRIKRTWCARSAIALLCFSLQWLIRRVLLCGSRHFTHGYIKPVGGRSRATYHVCVSMHDSLMKYWRALSWTIGWPAIPVPSFSFSPPAFILLPWRCLSQHSVQIRKANLIWSHDRANPLQLQNEKAVWSESIPRTSMGSFSHMPCPLQPRQCSNMMKRGPGGFGSLALFMRKGIMKNRGTALKMERCSDHSLFLCVMCTFLSWRLLCPSPWWKLDVFGLGFLIHWSTFSFTDWSHYADSGKQSCQSTQQWKTLFYNHFCLLYLTKKAVWCIYCTGNEIFALVDTKKKSWFFFFSNF